MYNEIKDLKTYNTVWFIYILFFILTSWGCIGYYVSESYKASITVEERVRQSQEQVSQLTQTISNMNTNQTNLQNYISQLEEENNSLSLEIEQLQEENAKMMIAAEILQKKIDEIPVVENNYAIINLTDDERQLLAEILALEAYDQPDCGQRAVVEVVFNRVLTGWASSVREVIYQKGQFATVKYLNNPYNKPRDKEYENIDWVLAHGSTILPPDYVYFATYKANGKDFIQIEDHYFAR